MPWLSHRSRAEEGTKTVNDAVQKGPEPSSGKMVNFLPAQKDGLCGTIPVHHKSGGLRLMMNEFRIVVQNMGCLPIMAKALCSTKVLRSFFNNPLDAMDTVLQYWLAFAQIWMLTALIPAFIVLPGYLFVGFLISCCLITRMMTWPLGGHRVLPFDREKAPMTDDFSDERWIYVNGIMCSNRSLYIHCSRLSDIFGRSMTGIHNRPAGLVLDLVTIFLQRCFHISTPCTLTLYAQIRDACLTNSVHKIVLIGHSTGALHISIALDQLHASLPVEALSKIELYTFGSAAAHLSNPCLAIDHPGAGTYSYTRPDGSLVSPVKATLATLGYRIEDHERVIPHIEHYALASDIFARCGVLHHTRNMLDNRFCGRVFILGDHTFRRANGNVISTTSGGFMMKEHYLELLFPTDAGDGIDVLNQLVKVEIETAKKREFTAQGIALPQKSFGRTDSETSSKNQLDSPDVSPKTKHRASWEVASTKGTTGIDRARIAAEECEGKTVKQLSRLWRYAHGGRPVREGVPIVNGVGKPLDGKRANENGSRDGTMKDS